MNNLNKLIKDTIMVVIGNALLAFGYAVFAIPSSLIVGGATGIGLFIEYITHIDYTYIVFIINISMLILGYIYLGKKFVAGTLLSSFLYPIFLKYFEYIPIHINDILLCTIYAGVFVGIGLGLVFKAGYSTGGMDVPSLVLSQKTGISLANVINIVDTVILILQIIFTSYEGILYGIITVFISNYILEKTTMIGEKNIQVFVISSKYEEIAETIMEKVNRGCTFVNITTGYLHNNQKAVLCVVNSRQYVKLNDVVLNIDQEAFIISNEIHSVKGRGFTLEDINISEREYIYEDNNE